jgi:Ca-activated chloride channel family protein
MTFASPFFLLFLLALPPVVAGYVWLERRRGRGAAAWSRPALVPNMVATHPGRRRYVPFALFLAGLALLLVGFARPQAKFTSEREGATVVLAIDVSRSMQARDVRPTRLDAARDAAVAFLNELPKKYRVGLVTFADHASVPVPATYDRGRLRRALLLATKGEGTALGDGINRAVAVAIHAVGRSHPGEQRSPAAVLLLSDGAQTQGRIRATTAAQQARREGIPVSTVALGTPNGIVTRRLPGGYVERTQVPPDPKTLQSVARTTGGRFFEVTTASRLKRVYQDLGHRLAHERKQHEVTAGATGAALVFMLAGAVLSGLWFRRLA